MEKYRCIHRVCYMTDKPGVYLKEGDIVEAVQDVAENYVIVKTINGRWQSKDWQWPVCKWNLQIL